MTEPDMMHTRESRQMELALVVLREVIQAVEGLMPADATLARVFKQHHEFGSRDRRHYAQVVFSYFRWLGWIIQLAPDDLQRQVAWAIALEGNSDNSILTRWIELTGLDPTHVKILADSDLEGKAHHLRTTCNTPNLSCRDLIPSWVGTSLSNDQAVDPFIVSCQTRPPTWVYIEPSRVLDFAIMLDAQQIGHWRHRTMSGAVALESPFQLQNLERAWGRSIHVQDIGSQAVAAICRAQPGESWWDTCCGAGGKTLQLARQVGPDGAVLATDIRESILKNLQLRAASFRFNHITTTALDSANQVHGGRIFDGILIDAPCSGLGTWPRNPDARWRVTPEIVTQRAALQKQMLRNVAPRVKSGGILVYSVCTVTAQESTDVVQDFLSSHPHFQRDPFTDPLTGEHNEGERLILPVEGPGDGMYIARLRRMD